MRTTTIIALGLAGAALALTPVRAEQIPEQELRAEVPALSDLHEAIVPLWHEAWPAKDFAAMKGMVVDLNTRVAAVEHAELPGILRDKVPAWRAGIAALRTDMDRYARAAAADESEALLDAAEALHSDFERLVRIVRPPLAELEAFHVVLYQLVHHTDLAAAPDDVRELATALTARCDALPSASLPRRLADREGELRGAFAQLCETTARFKAASEGTDDAATRAALESVHARYQGAAALLE